MPKAHPPEVRARAIELVAQGYNYTKAAELVGVDRCSVRNWVGRPSPIKAHRHPEGLRQRAIMLRLDYDMSIRDISQKLGVGRSTVGEWVHGHGEVVHYITCKLCNERVAKERSYALFCSKRCSRKHHHVFGRVS
jgi:transposase-like protein